MENNADNNKPGSGVADGAVANTEDSQVAARRAKEMIEALKAALDLVYDPDGEKQLQHMVADYCAFTGLPMCLDLGCCDVGRCQRAERPDDLPKAEVLRELKVHQGSKG